MCFGDHVIVREMVKWQSPYIEPSKKPDSLFRMMKKSCILEKFKRGTHTCIREVAGLIEVSEQAISLEQKTSSLEERPAGSRPGCRERGDS
jgi:hypothetical protein